MERSMGLSARRSFSSSDRLNRTLNFVEFASETWSPVFQSFDDIHEPSGSGLHPVPPCSERMNCERFGVDLWELAVCAVSQHQRLALAVIAETRAPPEMPQLMGSDVDQGFGSIGDEIPPSFVLPVLIRRDGRWESPAHNLAGEFRVLGLRTARVVELHAFWEARGNDRLLEVLDGLSTNPQDNERSAVAVVSASAFSVQPIS
jgi:hypothetical protein